MVKEAEDQKGTSTSGSPSPFKVTSIRAVDPGSGPDVDSDFRTDIRESVVNHVAEIYGEDNVANIITAGKMGIKASIKNLCMVYRVPPASANKVTKALPRIIEEGEVTLGAVLEGGADKYPEASDFLIATASPEWQNVLKAADRLQGRIQSFGQHACGVVISSQPIRNNAPVTMMKGHKVAQWEYPELESVGLIKMDFLGLDTVDIINNTIKNIQLVGKKAPNMNDLIRGDMQDPKTYQMLGRGETSGVFQLSGDGVTDLLKKMNPKTIDDIAATTALYRPGPMGMNSHIKYADRAAGREKVEYPIHPEFKDSPLEEILGVTRSLVVYQEQVMAISSQICGMTLQEGDDLRSAMGKKKWDKMMSLKPKFMNGGTSNGYSEEAMKTLWDTILDFAKYGFNKSHSYAYAINAYQTAYLKANYPAEFFSAILEQNSGNKDKVKAFLNDASRMGLKVSTPDINKSMAKVAPTKDNTDYDIVFGLGTLKGTSHIIAEEIVEEREKNGPFKSVKDFVGRMNGSSMKRTAFEALVYSGAFDSFGVPRKGTAESYQGLLKESTKASTHGASLFDMLGMSPDGSSDGNGSNESSVIDMSSEFPFTDKLKKEADVIGLYVSGHPMDNIKNLPSLVKNTSIEKLRDGSSRWGNDHRMVVCITGLEVKQNRKSKTIFATIDDGTGSVTARLSPDIVALIDKYEARETIRRAYLEGKKDMSPELAKKFSKDGVPIKPLELNSVYQITAKGGINSRNGELNLGVTNIRPFTLGFDGRLPIRVRINKGSFNYRGKNASDVIQAFSNTHPGESPIVYAEFEHYVLQKIGENDYKVPAIEADRMFLEALEDINDPSEKPLIQKGSRKGQKDTSYRVWPPKSGYSFIDNVPLEVSVDSVTYIVENKTGNKSVEAKMGLSKNFGPIGSDTGVMDPSDFSSDK